MHPVDFFARIPAPRTSAGHERTGSGITWQGACVGGDIRSQTAELDFIARPPHPRPGPNWTLRYQELINADFTNFQSIDAAYATEAARATIEDDAVHVRLRVRSGAVWGGRGLYRAGWRVWWEQGPCTACSGAERCFGGQCCRASCDESCGAAVTACAAGERCFQHACCRPRCAARCGGVDDGCGGRCTARCPARTSCQSQRCVPDVPCRCASGLPPRDVTCNDVRCANFCARNNRGGRDCL